MATAVYPGSFDPVTKGHLDIIERAASLVDELVVAVLKNNAKTPLFSEEERVKMIKDVTGHIPNVRVESFSGLSVEFAKQCGAKFIVRGLRAVTDFEYELQMAQTNHKLAPDIETTFLTTSLEYSFLSSTTVKEIASFGRDISQFVPPIVNEKIKEKMEIKNKKESITHE